MLEQFNFEFLGNDAVEWLYGLALSAGLIFSLMVVRGFIRRRRKEEGRLTPKRIITGIFSHLNPLAIVVFSIFSGSLFLEFPDNVDRIIRIVILFTSAFQFGVWINSFLGSAVEQKAADELEKNPARATTIKTFGIIGQFLVWVVIFLFAIDNISGIKLNALIASLGIGGIAVGFAVKSILDDLFASLSITLDQPFVIGDFIEVGEFNGKVERIGLKSTTLRSRRGELLIFGNADLLNSRIRNYQTFDERVGSITLGVHPNTPIPLLEKIPDFVREIVNRQKNTNLRRIHLIELGRYTLDYELLFNTSFSSFSDFLDIKQAIILGILDKFNKEGIIMPFPVQHIMLEKIPEKPE